MTEQEKFLARFDVMKKNGLIDIKFFVRRSTGVTIEDFFADANRIEDDIEAERTEKLAEFPRPLQQYGFFSHPL
ncbi:hypothetical protein SAE02_68540 [Skermanella aerolata]|uniref:Uncharacterized protein n=1 Tax=Skermanella aerolata TaxID=393310 RepID=A0A512E205_9PROT|nr:hypothetical protein [Skermanella aerolata]KJB91119.1 hypothetical protein N826_33560 [Skermanella aerolata KACC 11604]GEO42706.1 hypothetical protein SAE02_68540 [Skermanella aerolata]